MFRFNDPPQSWIHEYAKAESIFSSSIAGAGGLGGDYT